jgi:hypothetical protein
MNGAKFSMCCAEWGILGSLQNRVCVKQYLSIVGGEFFQNFFKSHLVFRKLNRDQHKNL